MSVVRGTVNVVARGPAGHIERVPQRILAREVYAGTDPLTGREVRLRETCKTERAAQIELGRLLEQARRDASPRRRRRGGAARAAATASWARAGAWMSGSVTLRARISARSKSPARAAAAASSASSRAWTSGRAIARATASASAASLGRLLCLDLSRRVSCTDPGANLVGGLWVSRLGDNGRVVLADLRRPSCEIGLVRTADLPFIYSPSWLAISASGAFFFTASMPFSAACLRS